MASIKLGSTKVANKLMSYCEKKSVERDGVDCNPNYAKSQFKATRELWGKNKGVQAHHVIQSFSPGEITPYRANEIGKELAKELAKGHEVVVYTHADTRHIHNHIIINSVCYKDGKKYQSKKKDLYRAREISDRLCKERNLSVIKKPSANVRYTLAEKGLIEKGQASWKDELRQVIDIEKHQSRSFDEFKSNLHKKYGIEVKERGQYISYKHPDKQKFVRGKTLGLDYERGTLENGFSRQVERTDARNNITSSLRQAEGIKPTIQGRVGKFTPEGTFGGISNVITTIEKRARQLAPKLREDEPSIGAESQSSPKLEPNVEPKHEEPVREVKYPRIERSRDFER